MATFAKFLAQQGSWVTSDNEEHYDTSVSFVVKSDAIEYGRKEGHKYIGRISRPDPSRFIDVEKILEGIVCDHDEDFGGEWFEGYLQDNVNKGAQNDLQERLSKAFSTWLTERELWPDACNIVEAETIDSAIEQSA